MSDRTNNDAGERSSDSLVEHIAAGAHDDALVRLAAGHVFRDVESSAWADARFAAWWGDVTQDARASRRTVPSRAPGAPDDYLAPGRRLRARALALRMGVAWFETPPPVYAAPVVGPPAQVIGEAAEVGATPRVDLRVAAGVGRDLWDEPAESWIELPSAVRDVAPRGTSYLAVCIAGDSMEPLMHTGSTVLVALGATPRVGGAVVARHPDDGYVCKQVRRIRAATIDLESLAADRPIITVPRSPGIVLGTVVAVWRAA